MIIHKLDSIQFRLTKQHDFTWLKKYGKAIWSVDSTGSGCVCIGMEDNGKRLFCKIAGVDTVTAEVSRERSIEDLEYAVSVYRDLEHPNLIKLIDAYYHDDLYIAVFEWSDGECLFDHWNFGLYAKDPTRSPKERFCALPIEKKLRSVDDLFSFMLHTIKKGYEAIDLYEGSILYDFATDTTTICDIDYFRKPPIINDVGANWVGTPRLKAPEEYTKEALLDEQTNIFTLGALLFEFFGNFTKEEIDQRYRENRFIPCPLENWQANEATYRVALRAVSPQKCNRYATVAEFYSEWRKALT